MLLKKILDNSLKKQFDVSPPKEQKEAQVAQKPVVSATPPFEQAKAINPGGATVVPESADAEGIVKNAIASDEAPEQKTRTVVKPLDVNEPAALRRYRKEMEARQQAIEQAELEEQQRIEEEEAARAASPYMQIYQRLYKDQEPETEEEREKRERRERANMNMYNLSDALAHVANLWGTSGGALSVDLSSLSESGHKRFERAREIRRRNDDAWRRGMYQAMQADMQESRQMKRHEQQMEQRERDHAYKIAKDIADQEWKKEEREYKRELDKIKQEQQETKDAETKRINDARIRQIEEQIAQGWARVAAQRESLASRGATQRIGGQDVKVLQFAMSDGSNLSVPQQYERDYYADVFAQLAAAVEASNEEAERTGDNEKMVMEDIFFDYSEYGEIAFSSRARDAVHLYAKQYPEIETYMRKRAGQMWQGLGFSPEESQPFGAAPPVPTSTPPPGDSAPPPTDTSPMVRAGGLGQYAAPADTTTTSYPNQKDIAAKPAGTEIEPREAATTKPPATVESTEESKQPPARDTEPHPQDTVVLDKASDDQRQRLKRDQDELWNNIDADALFGKVPSM